MNFIIFKKVVIYKKFTGKLDGEFVNFFFNCFGEFERWFQFISFKSSTTVKVDKFVDVELFDFDKVVFLMFDVGLDDVDATAWSIFLSPFNCADEILVVGETSVTAVAIFSKKLNDDVVTLFDCGINVALFVEIDLVKEGEQLNKINYIINL